MIEAIAAIFINDGAEPEVACDKAASLIEKHGEECCERQLGHFPRRCELARASEEGLRNPSGLFIRSVQDDWAAPSPTQKNPPRTWYTDEEYENFIQH